MRSSRLNPFIVGAWGWILASSAVGGGDTAGQPVLHWDDSRGMVVRTADAEICLDRNDTFSGPIIRFPEKGPTRVLAKPKVDRPEPTRLRLGYTVNAPGDVSIEVVRDAVLRSRVEGVSLVETFSLSFGSRPLATDLEIERPFTLSTAPHDSSSGRVPTSRGDVQVVWPLYNGRAKPVPLTGKDVRSEYRLGNPIGGEEVFHLALPMAYLSGTEWGAGLFADPTFAVLFEIRRPGGNGTGATGSLIYRYAASRVPLRGTETRTFGVWLARGKEQPCAFENGVDAFFDLMLPDVPPGPKWLHEIAMVYYDFLSDGGQGWERDVRALTDWLKPDERRRVVLCLHGWYDALGSYCFDAANRRMKSEWIAFEKTRKVTFTEAELKRRIRLAKEAGFRVLLYYGDGVNADSGYPGYRDEWAYRDARNERIEGWQGPDTFGTTYFRNPAHPEVVAWYHDYLAALLKTYGTEIDGVVWDETFHMRIGWIAARPEPAYADRAMFALVKSLRQRVKQFDREKVFLASDCIGVPGMTDVPGYALVADGTYQDSHCNPMAWSYGLFPNWRNSLCCLLYTSPSPRDS